MRTLVTGAAGFIGSTLVDHLLAEGHDVRGVDAFTPYYAEAVKRANLAAAQEHTGFELVEADLRSAELEPLLVDVEVVFHLAAQAGVRPSWADGFADYVGHNVLATQRLLEAVRGTGVRRLVYSSSSSVYGRAEWFPTAETDVPRPHSPYGVTKLAGEHLCEAYGANHAVDTISLRYFTVYGPRQRPDMAIHRLIEHGLAGAPFPVYGDGGQEREFTYVDDVVRATVAAAAADTPPGAVVNVGGGGTTSVRDLIVLVGEAIGRSIDVEHHEEAPGDVRRTSAATERAELLLDWAPRVAVGQGLAAQVAWQVDQAR